MNIEATTTEHAADLITACSTQTEDIELQTGARRAAELGGALADHREKIAEHAVFEARLLNARQTINERSTAITDEISGLGLTESGDVLRWAQDGADGSPPVDPNIERLNTELRALNRGVEFGAMMQRAATKRSAELAIQEQLLQSEFEIAVAALFDAVTARTVVPILALQGNVTFQGEAAVQLRESAAAHARQFEILTDQLRRNQPDDEQ